MLRLRSSKGAPEPERNEKGIPVITKDYLRKQCEDQEQYSTPHLNTRLYLASKGFQKIQNLEEYVNVRALYLNDNVILRIENLAPLKHLKCLFLQNNYIQKIEGFDTLINVETLNLSHNQIERIENLENMFSLSNLDLSCNKLTEKSNFSALKTNTNLTTLNLAANSINHEEESVIEELKCIETLKVVYLKQNGIVAEIKNYRKRIIHELPSLVYLDERPVGGDERKLATGFITGGKQGEMKARELIAEEREKSHKAYLFEIKEARAKFQKHRLNDLENFKNQVEKENEENLNRQQQLQSEMSEKMTEDRQQKLTMLEKEIEANNLQIAAIEQGIEQCKIREQTEAEQQISESQAEFETVPTIEDSAFESLD